MVMPIWRTISIEKPENSGSSSSDEDEDSATSSSSEEEEESEESIPPAAKRRKWSGCGGRDSGPLRAALTCLGFKANETPTADAVKARWREKALECHPDKGGCASAFRAVQEAYDVCRARLFK